MDKVKSNIVTEALVNPVNGCTRGFNQEDRGQSMYIRKQSKKMLYVSRIVIAQSNNSF